MNRIIIENLLVRLFLLSIVIAFCMLSDAVGQQPEPSVLPDKISDDKASEAKRLEAEGQALARRPDADSIKQGIRKLEQSAAIFIEIDLLAAAAMNFNQVGVIWGEILDDREKQIEAYKKALALNEKGDLNDGGVTKGGIALAKLNLGSSYAELGEAETAVKYYEEALPTFRENKSKYREAITLQSIAELYMNIGSPKVALKRQLEALRVVREIEDRVAESELLYFLAAIYDVLGDRAAQLSTLNAALNLQTALGNHYQLSRTHHAFGQYYQADDKFRTAIIHFNRSLSHLGSVRSGNVAEYGKAGALGGLGNAYAGLKNFTAAVKYFTLAQAKFRQIGDLSSEAWISRYLGRMFLQKGERDNAFKHFNEELLIRRRIGDKPREAQALAELQYAWTHVGNKRVAIFYGKQAVNTFQELRRSAQTFDAETRRAYQNTFAGVYKRLADLLAAEGRLPEAQAVMAMLKDEEVFDYVRRDASVVATLSQRADLRAEERAAIQKYEELERSVGALGAEFAKLQEKKNALSEGTSLTPNEQNRYEDLAKRLEDANTVFQVFLRQLADEFAAKPGVVEDVRENAGLQADLAAWGSGVVSVYTILGEDRYRAILTTPNVQVNAKTEIKAADLNRKIAEFRTILQDPKLDPRPLGKEIYDILVKPIESQLAGAGAKTILWSLDGAIRYVPMAALWDGNVYFGQKYENVIITLASRSRLGDEPRNDWRVLGLGVTSAKEVVEPGGTAKINFSALPSVETELKAIVRDERQPADTGVLAGKTLIDDSFTESTLKESLGKGYKAVHIASHFAFRPGDMTRSFLLLGDGSALTMDKFKTSPQLRFGGVELLTLSACETAVGETGANGREIESFGVLAQQNGAKAVMATLWPVADESTALLMAEFYRLKQEDPSRTKAAAIREAQKAMIEGRLVGTAQGGGCRGAKVFGKATGSTFKCDPNAPFSHPYFWAPFVLIGNWR